MIRNTRVSAPAARLAPALLLAIAFTATTAATAAVVSPEDILTLRYATNAVMSPDGTAIAYTVSVPRDVDDENGPRYTELHVVDVQSGKHRPFVTGEVNVGTPRWSPDGKIIAFRMKRGDKARTQVWAIPVDGGEARVLTHAKENVLAFRWSPDGKTIAYVATEPKSKREEALDRKGYGFTFYEEGLRHRNLYTEPASGDGQPRAVTHDLSLWDFEYSPDGRTVAAGASTKNLIDYRYAFQHVYLIDMETGEAAQFTENPGKLGNYAFSPDGKRLAYTAGLTQSDHAVSQVFVKPIAGGEAVNLTEPDFHGHVEWCAWKDNGTVACVASEGVWKTFSTVKASGGDRKVIYNSEKTRVNMSGDPTVTRDFKHFAFTATAPDMPRDVFYWGGKGEPKRLTELNAWIAERDLGKMEIYRYAGRDGYGLEGLLVYPVGYQSGTRYPLVVQVHGGPESHQVWGWRSAYSRPVQVLAGEGYFVFLPNYRSSTGYGLGHVAAHLGDAAGVEFDDIADGIKALTDAGLADGDRVGLGGGSYGGYAAAWFATYYTQLVRGVVMFVGISDLISKRGTTDIPYEELYVHSGKKLEDMWQQSLERSPIYYAHQSKTATLIIGGEDDTRVHPSQSLELYRRMKMNDHPAVRLVRYPGEHHGNRNMSGRRDVLYRTLQWYDWYIRDAKPLDGPMPAVDISDQYGLDLEN